MRNKTEYGRTPNSILLKSTSFIASPVWYGTMQYDIHAICQCFTLLLSYHAIVVVVVPYQYGTIEVVVVHITLLYYSETSCTMVVPYQPPYYHYY